MKVFVSDVGALVIRAFEQDGPFIVASVKKENGELFAALVQCPNEILLRNISPLGTRMLVFYEPINNLVLYTDKYLAHEI